MTAPKKSVDKDEYAKTIIQWLAPLGPVTSKKMFGGVGFFLDGLMFAKLTGEGTPHFRVDDTNRADYERLGASQFNSDSKKKSMPYYEVPAQILEDEQQFVAWARKAHAVAVANKKR